MHYLVWHNKNPSKKRHYTVCNCMEKRVYKEYLRIIEEFSKSKGYSDRSYSIKPSLLKD